MADRKALEFNGTMFESTICRHLISRYPEAVIMTNVQLFSDFLKKDTQIDIIMIHPRGVFVIEAKGWKRWVAGGYGNYMWNGQSSGMNVMKVFSPVNQNVIHIRCLRNAIRTKLGVNPVIFHNLVCFPDGTDLNTQCSEVCNLSLLPIKIDGKILMQQCLIDVFEYKRYIEEVSS